MVLPGITLAFYLGAWLCLLGSERAHTLTRSHPRQDKRDQGAWVGHPPCSKEINHGSPGGRSRCCELLSQRCSALRFVSSPVFSADPLIDNHSQLRPGTGCLCGKFAETEIPREETKIYLLALALFLCGPFSVLVSWFQNSKRRHKESPGHNGRFCSAQRARRPPDCLGECT